MNAMLFPMELTVQMVLIVVIGVFLASFVDGIAGGGGLISVPAYFLAGLPAHLTLGTNKLSSCIGTTVSTARFIRSGYVNWKLGIPSVALALIGAHLGTRLQLTLDERYLKWVLLIVLPVVAFVVLRQRKFPEEPGQIAPEKQAAVVLAASLVIGAYDGFYGPGTGTFLLLVFCHLGKLDVRTASGNMKLVNLSSNVGALATSLMSGKVFIVLGLIGAVASITGHYIGSGLAIKDGSRIVKPVVLTVLALLAVKVLWELIA
jgi:uncharacterized membrane protein YfcA